MAASKMDISYWFDKGLAENATHMLVVCDTYDYEDYPVYVLRGQDPKKVAKHYCGQNMQSVMECYNLTLDKNSQLNERRAHHYEEVNENPTENKEEK